VKIIILHGDDTVKSFERLKKFIDVAKSRSYEINYLDESSLSFIENLESTSLFGDERFFILRDVKKISKKDFEWLGKKYADLSGTLIVYSENVLSVTAIKSFSKDSKIEEFKLPVLLWNFLDGMEIGNSQKTLQTFHKIIEKEPVEFVFTLIAKRLRDLYWIKIDPKTAQFQSWQISKMKKQLESFSVDQLKICIEELAQIDIKVKTSKADLISELDLFIIKQLK